MTHKNCNCILMYPGSLSLCIYPFRHLLHRAWTHDWHAHSCQDYHQTDNELLCAQCKQFSSKGCHVKQGSCSSSNHCSLYRHYTVASLNVRSLTNKSLMTLFDLRNHIMFIVETWVQTDGLPVLIEACPPDYTFYQSVRQERKGG